MTPRQKTSNLGQGCEARGHVCRVGKTQEAESLGFPRVRVSGLGILRFRGLGALRVF